MKNFLQKLEAEGIFGWNYRHLLTHPWKFFGEIGLRIKWAWQRVFRGWDDRVVWSIDYYLANMIPAWISTLMQNHVGVPMEIMLHYPMDENYNTSDEDFKKAQEEWKEILYTIVLGFTAYKMLDNLEYGSERYDRAMKIYNRGFDNLRLYFMNLWD